MIKPNPEQEVLIVGTGYVGLITALGLAKLGHSVACYDINPERVASLKRGKAPFYEPRVNELIVELSATGRLSFHTTLEEAYQGQRYIFVAVQTPQSEAGKSDLKPLRAAITSIAKTVRNEALVVVKSTVPVGIFEQLETLPAVKKHQKISFVACPEFLAEGTAVRDFFNPLRTIVGSKDPVLSREVAGLFYGLGGTFIITDAKTAQMIKYGANSFLATRVAFINEMAEICEKFGINVNDVAKALVMDPRVGGTYLWPSVGFGGPCLPKDIAALIESSETMGVTPRLLRGASEHNMHHLAHVIEMILKLLAKEKTVAIFGLSFKPNTDDVRNAFSLKIITALNERGVTVRATDPQAIPAAQSVYSHELFELYDDPFVAAKGSSVQLFLTPWDEYKMLDYARLAKVVKHRRIFDGMQIVLEEQAIAAGFTYQGIGNVSNAKDRAIYEISDNPAPSQALTIR